jgi:hypothetical protein
MRQQAGWAAALGAVAALAAPPAARAEDEASRVGRLEEALRRQSEEMARMRRDFDEYRSRNPAMPGMTEGELAVAVDSYLAGAPPAIAAGSPAPPRGLGWGGYFHTEFLAPSNSTRNTIDVHRLILAANSTITDHIDFRTEIEIEHGGINNNFGPLDGDILVEFAEVVFRVHDAFNPKVGAILIPFGGYNHRHDDPMNDFTLRPYTARFFVPTGFGQPGIGVEGAAPFGCGHVFSYDVALTNGFDDEFSAANGVRASRHSWRSDNNDDKQLWGRVQGAFDVLDGVEVGLSGTWGRYDDDGENDLWGWGVDLLARWGPVEVKGEYIAYDIERDADDPADAVEGMEGFWLEAAYHFFPDFWRGCTGAFKTDTSLFTLAVRWQHQDTNEDVEGAHLNDDLTQWSVGLNYRITEATVFRVDHTWFLADEAEDFEQWAVSFSTYL